MGTRAAGLLLAAGEGRRYGMPKALVAGPDGVPWVTSAASVLLTAGCAPVLVAVGARAADVVRLLPDGCRPVEVAGWVEGMGASLRAGTNALEGSAAEAVVVHLVDLPDVGADVVARLLAHAAPDVLARAAWDGVPGHPVLLGRAHWAGVAAVAEGDAGARAYLASRGDVVLVECGDLGSGRDVDTRPDVRGCGC